MATETNLNSVTNWTSPDIQEDARLGSSLDRTLANIARRAETLWDDGYACDPAPKSAHYQMFAVTTPKRVVYFVTITDTPTCEVFGDKCTCPAWEKYGECKHHLAVLFRAWEQEQCAEHDARQADADAFDPFDDFEFRNFCGEGVN